MTRPFASPLRGKLFGSCLFAQVLPQATLLLYQKSGKIAIAAFCNSSRTNWLEIPQRVQSNCCLRGLTRNHVPSHQHRGDKCSRKITVGAAIGKSCVD